MHMKMLNVLVPLGWGVLAISSFIGSAPNNLTCACGFLCAALCSLDILTRNKTK